MSGKKLTFVAALRAARLALPANSRLGGRPRLGWWASASSSAPGTLRDEDFEVTGISPRYVGRYRTVFSRRVLFPSAGGNGPRPEFDFDVLGDPAADPTPASVFVFPYEPRTKSVTLVREYNPGPGKVLPGFVAGFVDLGRPGHETLESAARMELSEEAGLRGGKMIPLTRRQCFRDKYATDKFSMWLNISAELDPNPLPQDAGERLEVLRGVPLAEVEQLILNGQMNSPSSLLGLLALREIASSTDLS